MDPQQQPPQQFNHDATMINSFGLPMSFGKQKNFNHNNHNSGAIMMENVQHQQQHQQHHHYQHHQNVQHRGNYNNNNYNHRGNRQKREHHQHSSHQQQHHQQHNYNNKRPRFNNHHSTSQNHHHQNQRSQKYKSNSDDHFDVTQYFKPSFLQDPWQPRVAAVFSPPTIVDPSMQEEVKRLDETGTTSTSQETVLVDTANNGVVDVVTSNEEIMNPECIDI